MAQVVFAVKHGFSDLQKRLEESMPFFHGEGFAAEIKEKDIDGWPHLICSLYGQNGTPGSPSEQLYKTKLVDLLTSFIAGSQAGPYLNDILRHNYFYFPRHERQQIINFAEKIMEKENDGPKEQEIKNEISVQLESCLLEHDYLNIHGLIVFRLGKWLTYLRNCLDLAVDEFLMEKEYQEFIKLLKYFVQLQEPKVYQIHVTIDEQGNLLLFDQNHNIIDDSGNGVQWENPGDKEDMLVSTLITVAPQRIVLHKQVYVQYPKATDTLKHVFEKRVMLCKRCKLCHDLSDNLNLKGKS
ncbi:MAG: putative sporulation protein YtxC [Dethiobacter sp.]|nr:putative sporulation protein YtxC [Dethiobacter sp.]